MKSIIVTVLYILKNIKNVKILKLHKEISVKCTKDIFMSITRKTFKEKISVGL